MPIPRATHHAAARHLARVDPRMAALVRRVGPARLSLHTGGTHFEYLCRAIAGQQVSGAAARTIHGRVKALGEGGRFPSPPRVLELGETRLRAAGLSRQKVAAVLDLATHATRGSLPLARLGRLSDEEIINALTVVRGIGQWTVEMLLIFRLGRPDVLPVTDYGVQKGLMVLDARRKLPKPRELAARGAVWAPYRSVASWYLWRACEGA